MSAFASIMVPMSQGSTTPPHDLKSAGLALLRWYADAGVDEAVGVDAAALYAEATPAQTPAVAEVIELSKSVSLKPRPKKSDEEAAEDRAEQLTHDANTLAAKCASLKDLREAVAGFEARSHFPAARNLVFSDGNPDADLMLIGEAPGEQEDLQGKPFVGRSGQLLDRMLAAIGRDRTNTYITNVLPWRPMGNRTPTQQEGLIFLPFLMRHIELANPKLCVALGGSSAKLLMHTNQGIMSFRGTWGTLEAGALTVPILPTLHPAYLLRNSLAKREAWHDLLNMKQRLAELAAE